MQEWPHLQQEQKGKIRQKQQHLMTNAHKQKLRVLFGSARFRRKKQNHGLVWFRGGGECKQEDGNIAWGVSLAQHLFWVFLELFDFSVPCF